MIESNRIV